MIPYLRSVERHLNTLNAYWVSDILVGGSHGDILSPMREKGIQVAHRKAVRHAAFKHWLARRQTTALKAQGGQNDIN